jgi:hypothetical protein
VFELFFVERRLGRVYELLLVIVVGPVVFVVHELDVDAQVGLG